MVSSDMPAATDTKVIGKMTSLMVMGQCTSIMETYIKENFEAFRATKELWNMPAGMCTPASGEVGSRMAVGCTPTQTWIHTMGSGYMVDNKDMARTHGLHLTTPLRVIGKNIGPMVLESAYSLTGPRKKVFLIWAF
eukprot:Rmarinus@m.10873